LLCFKVLFCSAIFEAFWLFLGGVLKEELKQEPSEVVVYY
jgi:hypothetical protein